MSFVPDLTNDEATRISLTSSRYAFTVISNILVFLILYLFIDVLILSNSQQFQYLAYVTLLIGSITSLLFLSGTKEPIRSNQQKILDKTKSKWTSWFYCKGFYQVGLIYMCTRIVVNVSQVFLPFYLTDVLQLPLMYITIIPCTVYVSSFISALLMKKMNERIGRKGVYAIG
jgi:Na+/melibiose symporter-like transporter